jgi:hypothetical protein
MEKRLSIWTEWRYSEPGKSGLLFAKSHVKLPHPVGYICPLLSALDVSNQQSQLFAGNIKKIYKTIDFKDSSPIVARGNTTEQPASRSSRLYSRENTEQKTGERMKACV